MDLTPSQPVAPEDEPLGESPALTGDITAHAAPTAAGDADAGHSGHTGHAGHAGYAAESHEQPQPQHERQLRSRSRSHDDATASRSSREIGGKKFRVGAEDDYVPFRRRAKRRRRLITAVVAGLVLVGAAAYGVGSLIGSPSQSPTASGCPAKAGSAPNAAGGAADAFTVALAGQSRLPAAAQIKLNVYNSTNRHGLAATTATALKKRGFTIGSVTNDPLKANLTAAAEVRGASANAAAMHVVAAEVVGAELHADGRADNSVDLVLGAGFTALASPDQVSAALKQAQQQAALSPQAQAQAQAARKAGSKCG